MAGRKKNNYSVAERQSYKRGFFSGLFLSKKRISNKTHSSKKSKKEFGFLAFNDFYYCHPYSSYERGTNERINRDIRRLIPKGTDLASFSVEEIQLIENWVNNYPRAIFDYSTSAAKFEEQLQLIA